MVSDRQINIFWSNGLAFCPMCQSPLAGEEIDFEACDTCGGAGLPEGEDDFDDADGVYDADDGDWPLPRQHREGGTEGGGEDHGT